MCYKTPGFPNGIPWKDQCWSELCSDGKTWEDICVDDDEWFAANNPPKPQHNYESLWKQLRAYLLGCNDVRPECCDTCVARYETVKGTLDMMKELESD